jgi:hypothetical protein
MYFCSGDPMHFRSGVDSGVFRRTRDAFLEHEQAKTELKALMPEDAKEAIGHGVRARRSKSNAISFDILNMEPAHAPLQ